MVIPANNEQKSSTGKRRALDFISRRTFRAYGKEVLLILDKRLYRSRIPKYEACFELELPNADIKVSLLITTYNTEPNLLRRCIQSALHQTYSNLEVCIADDCSQRIETLRVIEEAKADPRVKVMFRAQNGHIAAATNTAFSLASGEWVAVLDHDDVLHPSAIAEVVHAIHRNPAAHLLYSDEDKIDLKERRFAPFFKPAFSLELLRSQNYINHLAVYRAEVVKRLGGWREGFAGSQDYDLNLRIAEQVEADEIVHIPKILYHWRAIPGSTALSSEQKSYAYDAGRKALVEHAKRLRVNADVREVPGTSYYRVAPRLPAPAPLVSIIVDAAPNSGVFDAQMTELFSKTSYSDIEVIMIRRDTPRLDRFQTIKGTRAIRFVTANDPSQLAAAQNRAVAIARGELICFLGGALVPQNSNWLGELVAAALLDGVGCVGPKLIYDRTVHSAGIALSGGVRRGLGHCYQHFRNGFSGHFARLKLTHNVAAVSSQCLVTRKNQFEKVGGFNEKICRGVLNDVDLALRMRCVGLRHVIEPTVELAFPKKRSPPEHTALENVAFENDYIVLLEAWGDRLRKDPYSPSNQASSVKGSSLVAEIVIASLGPWMSSLRKVTRY